MPSFQSIKEAADKISFRCLPANAAHTVGNDVTALWLLREIARDAEFALIQAKEIIAMIESESTD